MFQGAPALSGATHVRSSRQDSQIGSYDAARRSFASSGFMLKSVRPEVVHAFFCHWKTAQASRMLATAATFSMSLPAIASNLKLMETSRFG